MKEKIDIFSLADYGLKLAERSESNLKCAEMFFGKSKYISVEIEENSVKNSEIGSDFGASIRVIDKRGALGFALTNNMNKKSIEFMVKNAIKMMNAGTEDPDFKNLPSSYKQYPKVNELFDDNLKNIEIEDAMSYVKELIQICSGSESTISQSGEFSSNYFKRNIFNSNGLEANGKDTIGSLSSNMIVKDKNTNETSFGYEYQSERKLKDINAEIIGTKALENGLRNLNRVKVKNMKVPLILTPNGTIKFILSPLASSINAETFQYKRSFLVDKREEVIGSEYLNVEDNGLIDGGTGSSLFDAEGVPCQNKVIIEKGKFLKSGLLHNSYTAGKEGIESTGNAARNSYGSVPSISVTNFMLKPENYSKDEMIKGVKEGIILDYTGDSPNIATGDFSGLILQGNLIKNGEIKEPLNETMFGVNLLDLFKNIEAVSKEFKVYGSYRAPYVKIKEVQIIGSATEE